MGQGRGSGIESNGAAGEWRPEADALRGSRVVVLGLARQGVAAAQFLVAVGAHVVASDLRGPDSLGAALSRLQGLPIEYRLGGHPLEVLNGADLICVSGGVPLKSPIVREAIAQGISLTNDSQLFLERCPGKVVGVTGSAGKTTTTALVGAMCRAAGISAWVGGNIGNPLLGDLGRIGADDHVVLELSSFQLGIMRASPAVAAVLNITPNHLDRHGTMRSYIAAKRHIVLHQRTSDVAVFGYDDVNARSLAGDAPGRVKWFSLHDAVKEGASGTHGRIALQHAGTSTAVCAHEEVQLLGDHNLRNVLAACALADEIGVPVAAMRRVATSFEGVEHRLELIAEVDGADWYNDSIATAPERAMAALRSFDRPIVLLAGGRDKKLPWDEFAAEVRRRVRHVVTFGEAGPMIAGLFSGEPEGASPTGAGDGALLESVSEAGTLEEAVAIAASAAEPGDVVLFSPGGTSFDAYEDFAERGAHFRELVRAL